MLFFCLVKSTVGGVLDCGFQDTAYQLYSESIINLIITLPSKPFVLNLRKKTLLQNLINI